MRRCSRSFMLRSSTTRTMWRCNWMQTHIHRQPTPTPTRLPEASRALRSPLSVQSLSIRAGFAYITAHSLTLNLQALILNAQLAIDRFGHRENRRGVNRKWLGLLWTVDARDERLAAQKGGSKQNPLISNSPESCWRLRWPRVAQKRRSGFVPRILAGRRLE